MEHRGVRTAVVHDDDPSWLDEVQRALRASGIDVVATTASLEGLGALAEAESPDLVVVRDWTAVHLERAGKAISSGAIVVVNESRDPADVNAAFVAGAVAYIVRTIETGRSAGFLGRSMSPPLGS